jgi:hypothetical protein
MKLAISPTLKLPTDVVTSTVIVYGGKGMGKTNFGSVLAEECDAARIHYAIVDPMGVWWGLRHSPDGKGRGVEVLILGGIHGDIPIEPTGGAVVADLVVDEAANVIVDISRRPDGTMWAIAERVRFVRDYCKRLYQRQGEKRRPILQFIDEAARFIPQIIHKDDSDVAACMGAIAVLVEEGRNVGVGVVLITQRSAKLNKDVAELADCMIAFRTVGPNSRRAVLDWLGEHVEKEKIKGYDQQVRALPRGTALVVSPGWLEYEGIAPMRARRTFDSSATPKGGKQLRAKGPGAKPDLVKYQQLMAATIEKAKAEDPKLLKKRIFELEQQVKREQSRGTAREVLGIAKNLKVTPERIVKVPALSAADRHLIARALMVLRRGEQVGERLHVLEAAYRQVGPLLSTVRALLERLQQVKALAPLKVTITKEMIDATKAKAGAFLDFAGGAEIEHALIKKVNADVDRMLRPATDDGVKLKPGARRMVEQLAIWYPRRLTSGQLSMLAMVKRGGTFFSYLSNIRRAGYLDEQDDTFTLTPAGHVAAGPVDRRPTSTPDRVALYMKRLKPGAQRMLQVLVEQYPDHCTGADLAAAAQVKPGGTFFSYLSNLRTAGLIDERNGKISAAADLFMERT